MSPHQRRSAAIRLAIAALALAIPLAWAAGRLRVIGRRVRYGRGPQVPGLPADGEPLDDWERAVLLDIGRGWKHTARSRT